MNTQNLYTTGKELFNPNQHPTANAHTAVIPITASKSCHAMLLTERVKADDIQQKQQTAMWQLMDKHFQLRDIRSCIFYLGWDHENFDSQGKSALIQELLSRAEMRGKLGSLVKFCQEEIPHVAWPSFTDEDQVETVPKDDVAIVVHINKAIIGDVATYLTGQGIDADLLLMSSNTENLLGMRYLNFEENWEDIARLFVQVLEKLKLEHSKTNLHYFIAAPAGLAYLFGCAISTTHPGKVYQFEPSVDDYKPIGQISNKLKQTNL